MPKPKKLGRPPLPKGQSKERIYNLRLAEDEIRELAQTAKEEGQTVTELVRKSGIASPIWVKSRWPANDLHDKKIWVPVLNPFQTDCAIRMKGILKAREKPTGEKSIRIDIPVAAGQGSFKLLMFPVSQSMADNIEASDIPGADFKLAEIIEPL